MKSWSGMNRESKVRCNEGTKATDLLLVVEIIFELMFEFKKEEEEEDSRENKMHFRCVSFSGFNGSAAG